MRRAGVARCFVPAGACPPCFSAAAFAAGNAGKTCGLCGLFSGEPAVPGRERDAHGVKAPGNGAEREQFHIESARVGAGKCPPHRNWYPQGPPMTATAVRSGMCRAGCLHANFFGARAKRAIKAQGVCAVQRQGGAFSAFAKKYLQQGARPLKLKTSTALRGFF